MTMKNHGPAARAATYTKAVSKSGKGCVRCHTNWPNGNKSSMGVMEMPEKPEGSQTGTLRPLDTAAKELRRLAACRGISSIRIATGEEESNRLCFSHWFRKNHRRRSERRRSPEPLRARRYLKIGNQNRGPPYMAPSSRPRRSPTLQRPAFYGVTFSVPLSGISSDDLPDHDLEVAWAPRASACRY